MITFENVTISYEKGKRIINSLDLTIAEGTINGIVGLNGAGKTTLLNAIYRLKEIDSGKIMINNERLTKKSVSFLVTEPYFYSNITGNEYLSLFRNDDFDTEKWNRLFQLPLDRIVDEYSTGMKKKLAILSIIKLDKEVMILDEPFNGLDIETSRNIRTVLLKLKERQKTILITSHIIETLTNLCDYIHYLEDGKIQYSREKSGFEAFEKELFSMLENKSNDLINGILD